MELIDRQAAIDEAEEWIEAVYCDREEQRERSAIKKVIQGIKCLPSVQLATDTNVGTKLGTNLAEVGTDCISRQAAIEALVAETIYTEEELKEYYEANSHRNEWVNGIHEAVEVIKQLPPAQPEIKPIDYQDCANAMLRMWMDEVVTDGEYNRIMDKLNAHWAKSWVYWRWHK